MISAENVYKEINKIASGDELGISPGHCIEGSGIERGDGGTRESNGG